MKREETRPDYDWARDAEPIYTFLGIYVAAFQAMEGVLDQILVLAGGWQARLATLDRLTRMSNADKIEAAKVVALEGPRFARAQDIPGWDMRIETLSVNLVAERLRRNGILHASYMLRGVELGLNAIRTHRGRRKGAMQVDQEVLSRARMDKILTEVATLSLELSQVHLQLVHLVEDEPEDAVGLDADSW